MRNSVLHTTGMVAAFCLIAAGGVLQGVMTNRWGRSSDVLEIVKRLESFPKQVGAWELQEVEELSDGAKKMLNCDGYIVRKYLNIDTGEGISVAVLLGPVGPMSVHVPEVCYSSREYSVEQDRQRAKFTGVDGAADQLWELTLRAHSLDAHRLRVYYGWSADGAWRASENPRFFFANEPFLVKIQVAGRVPRAEEDTSSDLCRRFLKEFTPQLRKHLFAVTQPGKES